MRVLASDLFTTSTLVSLKPAIELRTPDGDVNICEHGRGSGNVDGKFQGVKVVTVARGSLRILESQCGRRDDQRREKELPFIGNYISCQMTITSSAALAFIVHFGPARVDPMFL
jgi:hypothetical protein